MGFPLGCTLANSFLVYHKKKKWPERFPFKYRLFYHPRYGVDMFVLFNSPLHLKRFQSYLNSCHVNIFFTIENQEDNKTFFLEVNIICEQGKFTTSVYRKLTFSRIYTHFDSFLPSIYKICMIHTLPYK